ncbi:BZ3500_MvSof-1268-A1-R1_Chr12-2g03889 [Microbotryum saponariae]|uniref:BZ3500_MvSof-1268-A1-R1_Chr12-2g03889 protein n=1 Tax=Microbotryum saponariae TaxID=289078 RepID=A0A2X0LEN3_9BASI|nr:BZ3500_MvSof-1268-A1-R1_Chr12-2g03889 [Microbotryum saponariae]
MSLSGLSASPPVSGLSRMFEFEFTAHDDAVITGQAFTSLLEAIQKVLLARPSPGFIARLNVLFALEGFCIASGLAYLVITFIDYQRRAKTFWLWRFVHRPRGRFIIGNVPIIIHGWVSSFANLQASLLSSQKVLNKHTLPPRWLNAIYTGGLTILLVVSITLNVHASRAWAGVWRSGLIISKTLMLGEQEVAVGDLDPSLVELARTEVYNLDSHITFFDRAEKAVGGCYIVTMACLIAINVIGLSLVLTLRRQISFNTQRFAAEVKTNARMSAAHTGDAAGAMEMGVTTADDIQGQGIRTFQRSRSDVRQQASGEPILVAFSSGIHSEDPSKGPESAERTDWVDDITRSTTSQMNDIVKPGGELPMYSRPQPVSHMSATKTKKASAKKTGASSKVLQEQAQNLLALKKIESDVIVLIGAITILAFILLAVGVWIAIGPSHIYRHWISIEFSLFLFPWAYVVTLALAHSALLYTAVKHLTPPSEASMTCRQALHPANWKRLARETVSGLTSITGDKIDVPSPGNTVAQIAVRTTVEVHEDRNEDHNERTHECGAPVVPGSGQSFATHRCLKHW